MCNKISKWDFLHLIFSWGSWDQELDAAAKCFPISKRDAKPPHLCRVSEGFVKPGLPVLVFTRYSCLLLFSYSVTQLGPFFATPGTAARQASLSFTISWSLLKLMSIESVMRAAKRVQIGKAWKKGGCLWWWASRSFLLTSNQVSLTRTTQRAWGAPRMRSHKGFCVPENPKASHGELASEGVWGARTDLGSCTLPTMGKEAKGQRGGHEGNGVCPLGDRLKQIGSGRENQRASWSQDVTMPWALHLGAQWSSWGSETVQIKSLL